MGQVPCVMSDGFNGNGNAANLQASGDLPATDVVKVNNGSFSNVCLFFVWRGYCKMFGVFRTMTTEDWSRFPPTRQSSCHINTGFFIRSGAPRCFVAINKGLFASSRTTKAFEKHDLNIITNKNLPWYTQNIRCLNIFYRFFLRGRQAGSTFVSYVDDKPGALSSY